MAGISGAFEEALAIQPPQSHHMVQRSPWISTSLVWLSRHLSAEHKGGILICFDSLHCLPQYLSSTFCSSGPSMSTETLKGSLM